jgi:hypothetical protein
MDIDFDKLQLTVTNDDGWWRQRTIDSNERGYRVIRVHELSNTGVQKKKKKKSLESFRW